MMRRSRLIFSVIALMLLAAVFAPKSAAQFRTEAFSQNYNDTGAPEDSVESMFSFKQYARGLMHKEELKIGVSFGGSTVFVGGQQIYNRQYWKLPIVYGTIGAGLGGGFYFKNKYDASVTAYNEAFALDPNTTVVADSRAKLLSTCCFAAAGLSYWGTLMDGVINFDKEEDHHAGRATIYSILLPGLGQVYNNEAWKVPIYWGGLIGSYYFYRTNDFNYKRFNRIYKEAVDPESGYSESISADTALYYNDIYQRYRIYSGLAMGLVYLLQIIDANVFAYMMDFEVNENLAFRVSPTIIAPDMQYAMQNGAGVGFRLGLTF